MHDIVKDLEVKIVLNDSKACAEHTLDEKDNFLHLSLEVGIATLIYSYHNNMRILPKILIEYIIDCTAEK